MKNSEILIEAKAQIEDEMNWIKGSWSDETEVNGEYDFLHLGQVCAVTAAAVACVWNNVVSIDLTTEVRCDCNCPHCEEYSQEARDIDDIMTDFDHPVRELLNRAAKDLYGPTVFAEGVNDDEEYTHDDVMKLYSRAIELARLEEEA